MKRHNCLLDSTCKAENIVYKCVASVDRHLNKVYLGTEEVYFKQWFYNHQMSFDNMGYSTATTLSKFAWEIKKNFKIMPSMK